MVVQNIIVLCCRLYFYRVEFKIRGMIESLLEITLSRDRG
jgi:hypothetical protein